jgi:thiamine-monophosphate kinase
VFVISVSDEGEFGLIRRLAGRFEMTPDVVLGSGDDGAVVEAPDGRVVVSTDLMVEGRHFRRDWSSGYDVGRKAAAANLADIVAMGARPTALVVGFAAPADLRVAWADALADGIRDECARVGATVVGGDVVASDAITVAITALGDLQGRAPLTRAGARPGDHVALVGLPGRAAAGLAHLTAGELDHPLAEAHRRPEPDYATALAVARSGTATAMIDVSDGLLADAGHIAVASGVRIEIAAHQIPIADDLVDEPAVQDLIVSGGDDHCFVVTLSEADPGLATIGRVVELDPGEEPAARLLGGGAGETRGGHEHFRS